MILLYSVNRVGFGIGGMLSGLPPSISFLLPLGVAHVAVLHVNKYPLHRDLLNVNEEEIEGTKFKGWRKKANYTVETQVVLQVDTTNVSADEYQIAPNISFLSTNQAIVNIYKLWQANGISFPAFQQQYAEREMALERYVSKLASDLNTARAQAGLPGQWYINYSLNNRKIEVRKP